MPQYIAQFEGVASPCSIILQRNRSDVPPDYGKYNAGPAPGQARRDGPPASPATPLDAALLLAELSDALGLGLVLTEIYRSKATRPDPRNTGDRSRADVWRNRRKYRDAWGVGDASGRLMTLDPDSPAAELAAAGLVGESATFRLLSPRGEHRVFIREGVPADVNVNWAWSAEHPTEGLAHKLDLVLGVVTLYRGDKTWLGSPADIAAPPPALRDAVAACYVARQERLAQDEARAAEYRTLAEIQAAERRALGLENNQKRGPAYARSALNGILAAVVALVAGDRARGLYALAYRAGEFVAATWSGLVYGEVEAQLITAGLACGLPLREVQGHVRNGLRDGMRNPRPEPVDRELPSWRDSDQAQAVVAGLEALAQAAASSGNLAKGAAPPVTAAGAAACAEALARRMLAEGRATVAVGLAQLAIDAGLGLRAARSAAAVLVSSCGWQRVTGGLGADGAPRASVWSFAGGKGTFRHESTASLNEREGLQQGAPTLGDRLAHSTADMSESHLLGWRRPVTPLDRGLRRPLRGLSSAVLPQRRPPGAAALEAILRAGGPSIRPMVRHLTSTHEGATAAELAAATGCSTRTAERALVTLAERHLVQVSTRATAGRPARVCALTAEARAAALGMDIADPSPLLAATLANGDEAKRRAEGRLAAERLLLEDARRVAQAAGVPVGAAVMAWREITGRQARAERDRSIAGLESPLVADTRRREGRVSAALTTARLAAARMAAAWAAGAPQAVPA